MISTVPAIRRILANAGYMFTPQDIVRLLTALMDISSVLGHADLDIAPGYVLVVERLDNDQFDVQIWQTKSESNEEFN